MALSEGLSQLGRFGNEEPRPDLARCLSDHMDYRSHRPKPWVQVSTSRSGGPCELSATLLPWDTDLGRLGGDLRGWDSLFPLARVREVEWAATNPWHGERCG